MRTYWRSGGVSCVNLRRDGTQVAGIALAVFLTAVLAVALWWGFLRDGDLATAQGIKVELDFSAVPDGAPPTTFEAGQPVVVSQSPTDPGANFSVRNGRLTYRPTVDGAAAAYLSTPDLGAPVSSLGASWVFESGEDGGGGNGAIALVVSSGIQEEYPPTLAPFPIHFVATAINWNLSVLKSDGGKLEPIAAASFKEPLVQNGATVYRVTIDIDGDAATIELPNGERRVVRDPRISQWQGNFATFEVYSNNGLTDSIGAFEHVWADSRVGG